MKQIDMTKAELAQKIDLTLLKPTLLISELEQLCREAADFGFRTVCIPPTWISEAIRLLEGCSTEVITVVGFPLGYSCTESKVVEVERAKDRGASEIDMVINISYLKNGRWDELQDDIYQVAQACGKLPLKVIIETSYLHSTEMIEVAKLAETAGAAYIKTSTVYATGVANSGATLEDIRLLRQTLKPETKIKASGGIRDFAMAVEMLKAGADRLGTSAGVAILNGLTQTGSY